jgi:hypothetical protein
VRCSRAPNLVPASGSLVAADDNRWLLTAVRGHLGDTPGACQSCVGQVPVARRCRVSTTLGASSAEVAWLARLAGLGPAADCLERRFRQAWSAGLAVLVDGERDDQALPSATRSRMDGAFAIIPEPECPMKGAVLHPRARRFRLGQAWQGQFGGDTQHDCPARRLRCRTTNADRAGPPGRVPAG